MPGSVKQGVEAQLWGAWPWAALAHFVLFAVIAATPVYGAAPRSLPRAMLTALALAVTTEWLQSFVPGRHPLVRDALIDLTGTLAGLLAARVFWPSYGQRRA